MNILDDYCKTYCIVQEQLKKMGRSDDNEPEMVNLAGQLQMLFESMESTSPTQTMLFRVTLPSSSGRSNRFVYSVSCFSLIVLCFNVPNKYDIFFLLPQRH